MPVHQRTAGVAGIDGGIGLNGFVDRRAVGLAHRPNRTHDAARHRPRQAKRIADGVNFLPHLQVARIAQHRGNQIGRLDLDHRQIVRRIGAHHRRLVFLAVVHGHFHLPRVGDDVIVGEDVALFVDHKARALALLRHQPVEKVESHRARRDVHHRRNILAIDADIVLLFAVERLRRREASVISTCAGWLNQFAGFDAGKLRIRTPGSEVKERASDQQRQ